MKFKIEYNNETETVELDNGLHYLKLTIEEVRYLKREFQRILRSSDIDKALDKDWKYYGGL